MRSRCSPRGSNNDVKMMSKASTITKTPEQLTDENRDSLCWHNEYTALRTQVEKELQAEFDKKEAKYFLEADNGAAIPMEIWDRMHEYMRGTDAKA